MIRFEVKDAPPISFGIESSDIGMNVETVSTVYGKSAYEIAVINGFKGTEVEWLKSLEGKPPVKGVDYYTEAEKQTFVSDIMDVLKSTMKSAKIGVVTLLASKWKGGNNLYSQIVAIDGVTKYSQVDITPDVEQLVVFYEKDLTFVTENDNGVVTVYAIGQKPTNDYTIQVTITEVYV